MAKLPSSTNDSVWKALNEKREDVHASSRAAHDLGYKAQDSGEEGDHLAAAKAHEEAFNKARSMGMGELAKQHAASAAEHEDAASNPDSPAYKSRMAKEASKQAWASGTKEDHEAAAAAHTDASNAHVAKLGGNSSWPATQHATDAKAHTWAAGKSPEAKPAKAEAAE